VSKVRTEPEKAGRSSEKKFNGKRKKKKKTQKYKYN